MLKARCATTRRSDHVFTISLEGNIGAGKSTLLRKFAGMINVDVLAEPVHQWQNAEGCNLLELMYIDPTSYGLTFQSYVQETMTAHHVQKPSSAWVNLKVMERSLYSSRNCFIKHAHQKGTLSDPANRFLTGQFNYLTTESGLDFVVDLVVYLRTSPGVAWERMQSRGRSEEGTVTLQYLQEIHDLHEIWLNSGTSEDSVLIIDGDQDYTRDPWLCQGAVERILERVDSLRGKNP